LAITLSQSLARQHFWLTFWGGLAVAPLLGLAVALGYFVNSSTHSKPQLVNDALVLTGGVWLVSTLPALLFCWLRLPAMQWLFAYCLARPVAGRKALAVLGTLVLFGASIIAGALVLYLWWRTAIEWTAIWRICTAMSLPWLLAALAGSWRVLRKAAAQSVN
jgi:hypothetical protein